MTRKQGREKFPATKLIDLIRRIKMTEATTWILFAFLFLCVPTSLSQITQVYKDSASPFTLKLKIENPARCRVSNLRVQAEIINESNEKAVIDVKSLWHRLSFTKIRKTAKDRSFSSLMKVGDNGLSHDGDYLVLNPGESHKENHIIKLDDDFFKDQGLYEVEVSYGQFLEKSFEGIKVWIGSVKSNTKTFKIRDCNNK
jgi:hypothetical protein